MTAWGNKFAAAFSGLFQSVKTQSSFWVHIPMALAVIAVASWLDLEPWRWCVLIIAIGLVIAAELINTAVELIIRVLHPEHDERVGHALDAAAAAVLVLSIAAVAVGLITMGPPLWQRVLG